MSPQWRLRPITVDHTQTFFLLEHLNSSHFAVSSPYTLSNMIDQNMEKNKPPHETGHEKTNERALLLLLLIVSTCHTIVSAVCKTQETSRPRLRQSMARPSDNSEIKN